jgi:DNA helicase HerA-like ATPase
MARRVAGKTTGKAGKAAGKSAAKAEPAVAPAVEPAPEQPATQKVVAPAPAKAEKAPEPVFGDTPEQVYVGKGESRPEYLMLRLANRHGLVTGATGTGKTVTLQVLAEGLSRAGVPVFASDIKGDLSGIAAMGAAKEPWTTRAKEVGVALEPDQFPVVFWDLFGEQGHPIRATVSEMGPLLLSRLLDLNDTQEGVLNITFRVADEQGLLLLDLKDLRAMLGYVADNAAKLTTAYGNVSKTSVGAIQRQLLVLENQGGAKFFGEPALAIKDFMRVDREGRGFINMLAADKLMENPRLYATFLLWLLSEMFEQLPEVGDPDKPKLVFFFDEAHLLFNDAPKALLDKIEQVVRLIRSKGVGVYFVTQNPLDVPERVLAQLGNRVQHALRAFTPRDQRAVRAAAETFRQNPNLDTAKAITELGKGEALVSFLAGNGVPSLVDRALIRPPSARVGPITPEERKTVMAASPVRGKYDNTVDSESAYEMLQKRVEKEAKPPEEAQQGGGLGGVLGDLLGGGGSGQGRRSTRMSTTEVVVKQVARSVAASVGTQLGRAIIRGVLGSLGRR